MKLNLNMNILVPKLVESINMEKIPGQGLRRVEHDTEIKLETNAKDLFMSGLKQNLVEHGADEEELSKVAFDKNGILNINNIKMDRNSFFTALIDNFNNLKNVMTLGNLVGSDKKMNLIEQNAIECYKYGIPKAGKPEIVDLAKGIDEIV